MSFNPYTVQGSMIPRLRGRKKEFEKIIGHLTKKTPDNLSIIGKKLCGKTVLLKGLEEHFTNNESFYTVVLYWDIKRSNPENDKDFYKKFRTKLKEVLKDNLMELVDYIYDDDSPQSNLRDIFNYLSNNSKSVLLILDGLDDMLSSSGITHNLWDFLRSLGELSSLRFVTGSRGRLQELCSSPESRTSDFWNIFHPSPIIMRPFSEEDWAEFLKPFTERGLNFDKSALKELKNWTGGIPVLANFIASHLYDKKSSKNNITKKDVDEVAIDVLSECIDYLDYLWDDCSAQEQGDLADIASRGGLPHSEIPRVRIVSLQNRGYVDTSAKSIKSSCRLMEEHVKLRCESITDLRRVFGDSKKYKRNIKPFLELRLAQLSAVDSELKEYIRKAIDDIMVPKLARAWFRFIVPRAFDLICEKEIPSKEIPLEWTKEWESHDKIKNPPAGSIPTGGGDRCKLLKLMTDSRNSVETRISRKTSDLIDFLQSVGDFGVHPEMEEEFSFGFAVSACLAAIEMCEQLSKDLASEK